MELKRFWLPYTVKQKSGGSDGNYSVEIIPEDGLQTETAEKELSNLIIEGWEIASVTPITGTVSNYFSEFKYSNNLSFTSGLEIFLIKK